MTIRWKLFRIICIFQLLLVGYGLFNSVFSLFSWHSPVYFLYKTVCYGLILAFMSQTLSILNYNYPDLPLSLRQKRAFNMLYLLNMLMIAFLFAQLISEWRLLKLVWPWLKEGNTKPAYRFIAFFSLSITLLNFLLHFIFLGGAYRLRRVLYEHLVRTWDEKGEAG
jgi:hypothetical protein